jgi:hypothetical protein
VEHFLPNCGREVERIAQDSQMSVMCDSTPGADIGQLGLFSLGFRFSIMFLSLYEITICYMKCPSYIDTYGFSRTMMEEGGGNKS